MENKEWRDIEGFEGLYTVSNLGEVINTKTGKKVKPYNNRGLLLIRLYRNGETYRSRLANIVSRSFRPKEKEKDLIVYLNGDSTDCSLDNIKWEYINPLVESECDFEEVWAYVKGYEDLYRVSNYGRLFSIKNNRIVLGRVGKGKNAYRYMTLHDNKRNIRKLLHVLVAEHFIDNPDNKPIINHKDGNKLNNHIKNIEWSTYYENNMHALETGLRPTKVVLELDLEGSILNRFNSTVEASKSLDVTKSMITMTCQGKTSYAKGHYLVFEKDYYEGFKPNKGYTIKKVEQLDLEGNTLATFGTISEASLKTGISPSAIYRSCSNKVKNPKKYLWREV